MKEQYSDHGQSDDPCIYIGLHPYTRVTLLRDKNSRQIQPVVRCDIAIYSCAAPVTVLTKIAKELSKIYDWFAVGGAGGGWIWREWKYVLVMSSIAFVRLFWGHHRTEGVTN